MVERIEVNGKQVEIKINSISSSKHISASKSNIFKWLERIGIDKEYVSIEHNHYGHEDPFAEIRWKVNDKEYFYRCTSQKNATACVAAIEQLVHYEVIFIERGIKSFGQVMNQFRIGYNPEFPTKRPAREIIGVADGMNDLDYITYKFKQKAKELHPDKGGDPEAFKELNEAFAQLKKELS